MESREYRPLPQFTFDHEPTFAELWEVCSGLFYNEKAYCDDMEHLLSSHNITTKTPVIDVAAGSGFPGLGLVRRNYNITCSDGAEDEVSLLNKRSTEEGLDLECKQIFWTDLNKHFSPESFDAVLCRGNSFIYAGGGWNQDAEVNAEQSLTAYREAATQFAQLLTPGGILYVDKFLDTEVSHRDTVASIDVEGKKEDLIFWTQRFPEEKIRRASMIRTGANGETGIPNITYDLTFPELEKILLESGFRSVEKSTFPSEKLFGALIAKK
jgi:methylase of polypeptide subunit release factors